MFGNIAIASNGSQLFNPMISPNLPHYGIVHGKITVCYRSDLAPRKSAKSALNNPPFGHNLGRS